MSAADDVDELIEQYHLAQGELFKGTPEPMKKLWSHRQDVSLANPWGPPVRGREQVAKGPRAYRIAVQRWRAYEHRERSEVCDC
jgi:hypothetical protein